MKKSIGLLLTLLPSTGLFGQNPAFVSADFITATNSSYILDVETDDAGNVYSTGYFYGDLQFPTGTISNTGSSIGDGFVSKKDAAGTYKWVKHLDGEGNITAVHKASDNSVFIAGIIRNSATFNGVTYTTKGTTDGFIARLNAQGQTIWFKMAEGSANGGYNTIGIHDMVVDGSNHVYFTGYFTDSVKYGNTTLTASGVNDIMIGKVDQNGNLKWMHRAGGGYGGDCGLPNNDNGAAIALDNANGVYITGHYAFNLQIGTQNFIADHNVDIYLAKFDRDGNFIWALSEGGLSWDVATSVACDLSNNVYISGYFQQDIKIGPTTYTSVSSWGSQYDIFIAKYNSNGVLIWSKQEGGTESEQVFKIATDYNSNLYIGGVMDGDTEIADSVVTGSPKRCFIAKYKSDSTALYLATGGGYTNKMYAFDLDRNNDVLLGGAVEAIPWTPATFGTFTATSTSHYLFNALLDDPFNSTFGINEESNVLQSQVSPNPGNGLLYFTWNNEEAENVEIVIYDLQGRLCTSSQASSGRFIYDATGLASGLYTYRINGGHANSGGKFVIF